MKSLTCKYLSLFCLLLSTPFIYGQDYMKLPKALNSHCTVDYMNSIYSGETPISSLELDETKRWVVYSDRADNILYTSAKTSKSNNRTLSYMQALYVEDYNDRGNWLKVTDQETKRSLGWIQSKYLILSKYSLSDSFDDASAALNLQRLIIPDLDKLKTRQNYDLKQIDRNKKFYNKPGGGKEITRPFDFEVYYVFKVLRNNGDNILLSTNNIIGINIIENKSIVKGWIPEVNTTAWETRLMLENNEDLAMKKSYDQDVLMGFKKVDQLEDFIQNRLYVEDSVMIQFEVDCMPNDQMRRPVIKKPESAGNDDNILRVVSITKDLSGVRKTARKNFDKILAKLQTKSDNVNIIFCIDATSSMSDYKEAISESISDIITENKRIWDNDLKFGVILYRDFADENRAMEFSPLTTNQNQVKSYINDIDFSSKNPILPESQFNGIIKGIEELELDENQSNIMILIGDCGNREEDKYDYTYKDVGDVLKKYEVDVISFQVIRQSDFTYDDFGYGIEDFIRYRCEKIIGDDNNFKVNWTESTKNDNCYEISIESTDSNGSEDDFSLAFGSSTTAMTGEPMKSSRLKKNIVDRINDYQKLLGENKYILNNRGFQQGVKVDNVAPGVLKYLMNKTGLSEEEAKEFLASQAVTMSAYVGLDYGNGPAQKHVVYMLSRDYSDLKKQLRKFDREIENYTNDELYNGFQDLLIQLVETIIGKSTHKNFGLYNNSQEIAENMTLNQAWNQIFGIDYSHPDFVSIKEVKLGEIATYSKKKILKKAISEFRESSQVFINSDYRYSCESCCQNRYWNFNDKEIFWVPLEDLPGTVK